MSMPEHAAGAKLYKEQKRVQQIIGLIKRRFHPPDAPAPLAPPGFSYAQRPPSRPLAPVRSRPPVSGGGGINV